MFVRQMILVMTVLSIPLVLLAADDPYAGTWKLNVAKSTYNPGPPPKSTVTTYEFTPDGAMKVTVNIIDAQGKPGGFTRVEIFDGKPHPVQENSGADAMSAKRIDPYTIETLGYKNGKVISTLTRKVSKDGKTLTATAKGTNARGQQYDEIRVFEKH